MSSRGERSDEEDVLELIGVNENQDSNHESGDELQANDQLEGFQPQNSDDNDPGNTGNAGQKVTPKGPKRAKSNIPRLTTQRLRGPKGVHTIEKYFEGFKFHGKGREKEDLDRIMKRLEHWSHRLFPKLNFDDCLEKIAHLGIKKDHQVFLKRYRLDMVTADEDLLRPELIDDDDDDRPEDSAPQEEFDLLLAEQINKQRQKDTSVADSSAFDDLLASTNSQNQNQSQVRTPRKEPTSALSDEVRQRIERNRKLAMERKLATMKKLQGLKMNKPGDNQNASTNDEPKNNPAQKPSDAGPVPDSENNSERMKDAEPIAPSVDKNKNLSQSDPTEKVNDSESADVISSNLNSERMEEDIPDSSKNLIENQDPGSENKNAEPIAPSVDKNLSQRDSTEKVNDFESADVISSNLNSERMEEDIPDSSENLIENQDPGSQNKNAEPIAPSVDKNKNLSQGDSTEKVNDSESADVITSNLNSERMEEDIPDSCENLIENQDPGLQNKNAEPIAPSVDKNKNLSQSDSTEKVNDSKSADLISSNLNSERMEEDIPDSSKNIIENQDPGSQNKNLETVEQMEDVSSLMSG